jgi:hypothetical protein
VPGKHFSLLISLANDLRDELGYTMEDVRQILREVPPDEGVEVLGMALERKWRPRSGQISSR